VPTRSVLGLAWLLSGILVPVLVGRPAASAPAPNPASASAAQIGSIPAGAGSPAVAARLDLAARTLSVRACATLPCEPASAGAAIDLDGPIDAARSSVRPVEIGAGRRILRVIAASAARPGIAWEALVGARPGGEATVIWSGMTAEAAGDGAAAHVLVEGGSVYVGRLDRARTLCGQSATLLEPKRVDPATLALHRVAMHRLPKAVRDAAPELVARPAGEAPIGSVLSVRGASVNDGGSLALADGDPRTSWSETLKGDGKGEFVVFSAPKAIPLARLELRVRPTEPPAGWSVPVSMWLSTDDATFRVVIAKESIAADGRIELPLPTPLSTSCIALSIDRGERDGDQIVGLAEVEGVPVVPPNLRTLADVVALLDAGEREAELARQLLEHAGARGAETVTAKLPQLGDLGRARAAAVLESTPCPAAAPALAKLSWDPIKPVAQAARTALDGCGIEAKGAIAAAFAEGPDGAREVLAERYARVDPPGALDALLAQSRTAAAARRHTYRGALARVGSTSVGREAIARWLGREPALPKDGEVDVLVELARAIADLPELSGATEAGPIVPLLSGALQRHAADDRGFEVRWLAAGPIAALSSRGDAPSLAWLRRLHADRDPHLRARAAEASAIVDGLRPEIVAALRDEAPRVRQAAAVALRASGGPGGATPALLGTLATDRWTFVRLAAAETLGQASGGGDVDVALAKALRDPSRAVRGSVVRALVARGARSQIGAIRGRAFDRDEAVDVRSEAVEALGALCDTGAVEDLHDLAKRGSQSDGAHQLALAAIHALGQIHPPDLGQRLSALDQTSLVVKDAVRRAMRASAHCR
jgi:hypothetical protein